MGLVSNGDKKVGSVGTGGKETKGSKKDTCDGVGCIGGSLDRADCRNVWFVSS